MTVPENLDVLSERELEVLKLVATGATNQQIARALVISPNTVKVHLRNIFEKLGVQSRTEATMEAVRRGWVPVPGEAMTPPAPLPPEPAVAVAAEPVVDASAPTEPVTPVPPPLPPISLVELMPSAPARPQVARWQHVVFVATLLLAVLGALAPAWLSARSTAATLNAFTDVGRAQVDPPARIAVQRWTAGAPLPQPRSRLALAALGGRIYALAGETTEGVTGEVTVYDPKTNGWLPAASKPTAVANVAAGVIGGALYAPGGSTAGGGVTDVLEIYDPAADRWSTGPALPRPLTAYALAVWGDKLYVFGGWDGAAYRQETLIFDPQTGAWQTGPALPGPRAFAGAATLKDVIYVAGGVAGNGDLAELLAFDPRGDPAKAVAWTVKAPMQQARAGLGLAAVGNQVFALGGSGGHGAAFNEQYDTRLDAWSRLGTPMTGGWRNLAVAAMNNKLYTVGGWSGDYLDVHEQYTALLTLLLPFTNSQ